MKWLPIFNSLKTLMLLIFVLAALSIRFGWFTQYDALNGSMLNDLRNLAIILYGLFYIGELRITLKQKDQEIARLKTQLNQ